MRRLIKIDKFQQVMSVVITKGRAEEMRIKFENELE